MPLLRVELLLPNRTVLLTLAVVGVVGEVVIPAILLVVAVVVFLVVVAPLAAALPVVVGVPLILVALQAALQGVPLVALPSFHAIRANPNMFLTEIWLSWLCTILN